MKVGKREFIHNTSRYLKKAEENGEIIITHQGKPCLKLVSIPVKTWRDLAGSAPNVTWTGDLNEPILPGYDTWSC